MLNEENIRVNSSRDGDHDKELVVMAMNAVTYHFPFLNSSLTSFSTRSRKWNATHDMIVLFRATKEENIWLESTRQLSPTLGHLKWNLSPLRLPRPTQWRQKMITGTDFLRHRLFGIVKRVSQKKKWHPNKCSSFSLLCFWLQRLPLLVNSQWGRTISGWKRSIPALAPPCSPSEYIRRWVIREVLLSHNRQVSHSRFQLRHGRLLLVVLLLRLTNPLPFQCA